MNTKKIGDDFESYCYNVINKIVQNGQLGVLPSDCVIYSQKEYYSPITDRFTKFDLAIELIPQGALKPSLIYLIECKAYENKVPVGKIQEFSDKVRNLAIFNAKPIMISKNGFQKGVHLTAEKSGIMLIVANADIDFNIILHKVLREKIQNKSFKYDADSSFFKSIQKAFLEEYRKINPNHKGIEVLSKQDIEIIANSLLDGCYSKINSRYEQLSFDHVLDYLKESYGIKIECTQIDQTDLNNRQIMSYCKVNEGVIFIDDVIKKSSSYRFYIAHELGHFFLHKDIPIEQFEYDMMDDPEYDVLQNRFSLINERNWLEWQANYFAVSLILPKEEFVYHFKSIMDEIGITNSYRLYVDHQPCNKENFKIIINRLSLIFMTSRTSVIYRLRELELLYEAKKEIKLSDLIRSIRFD